eukprot:9035130-Heterocapsa_arctica.AAC.1
MLLSKLVAMRIFRREAMDIIKEKQDHNDLDIVMEVIPTKEKGTPYFQIVQELRYQARHYASDLHNTRCMRTITGNNYTIAGVQGTFSEHTLDIEATI